MADSEVKLKISTDATGAITGMVGVSTAIKKMNADISSTVKSLKAHWLGVTAAVTGAMAGIKAAWDLADMASQFEEQMDSLNSLAAQYGTSADAIVSSIQDVSRGLISQADAASIAAQGLAKGLNADQLIQLSGAAETLSNVSGRKVVDIMTELSEALETGKTKALKMQLGVIDLEAALGNEYTVMSDTQKAQALYNTVIERTTELKKQLGDSTDSTNDKMERFTVKLKDLTLTIGQGLLRALAGLYSAFEWVGAFALHAVSGVTGLGAAIGWLIEKIPGLTNVGKSMKDTMLDISKNAMGASLELRQKAAESWSTVFAEASYKTAAKSPIKVPVPTEDLKKLTASVKTTLKTNLDQYEKYYADLKKLQGDYKSAIEKSLKEIADIDKRILESRYQTQQILADIAIKGAGMNEMEAYNAKVQKLQNQLTYAMQLSGEDRIKVLQDYQKAWGEMVGQIDYTEIERKMDLSGGLGSSAGWIDVEVKKTWLSLSDSMKAASANAQYAGDLIVQTEQEMKAATEQNVQAMAIAINELSGAISVADEWVKYLKDSIADLDKGLANPKTLTIDCTQSLNQLQQVLSMVQEISRLTGIGVSIDTLASNQVASMPRTITNIVPTQATGYSTESSNDIYLRNVLGEYANGTDYVPRTGLYKLHQGEEVTPAGENKSGITVNMGGVTITGIADPTRIAKQLATAIEKELSRRGGLRA